MPASFSPPRTTATPPSTGSLPTLSLETEQQLGFPAGAAASTSSLDTAGPTVPCIPNPFSLPFHQDNGLFLMLTPSDKLP